MSSSKSVRVAIVAESFLPQVNGVAGSVRHIAEQLRVLGHDVLIIAPGPGPSEHAGIPVVRSRSLPFPLYKQLPLGLPSAAVRGAIEAFAPDVVHLSAPVMLSLSGLRAAERLGVPAVAVYQTDLIGFAQQYGLFGVERTLGPWTRWLHTRSDLTLAPSRAADVQLAELGVERVARWARGVDGERFHPSWRDQGLRTTLAPRGEVLVGYVGRVATEKRVHLLRHVADVPGARLVVVGDGPALDELRTQAPTATFLGMLDGTALSQAVASLDVFVHTGAHETFCQAVQEAMAAGVPVVAPGAGGPLDLVQPGRTGLLYPPDDVGAFRAAVERLVADQPLRASMGAAARSAVRHRDWASVVAELVDRHYTPLLGRARRTSLTTRSRS